MLETTRIPIINLYDSLIVSIQVALSDELVRQLKEDITKGIDRSSPRGLILDISGVDLMDSYISRAIRDIGIVARLMGVQTVLCGLDPMIAISLVEMDLNLEGVKTTLNLEAAVEFIRNGAVDVQDAQNVGEHGTEEQGRSDTE